jgi:hypothetical protein
MGKYRIVEADKPHEDSATRTPLRLVDEPEAQSDDRRDRAREKVQNMVGAMRDFLKS